MNDKKRKTKKVTISKDDFILLKNANIIEISDTGKINWIDNNYKGQLTKYKKSFLNGDIIVVD